MPLPIPASSPQGQGSIQPSAASDAQSLSVEKVLVNGRLMTNIQDGREINIIAMFNKARSNAFQREPDDYISIDAAKGQLAREVKDLGLPTKIQREIEGIKPGNSDYKIDFGAIQSALNSIQQHVDEYQNVVHKHIEEGKPDFEKKQEHIAYIAKNIGDIKKLIQSAEKKLKGFESKSAIARLIVFLKNTFFRGEAKKAQLEYDSEALKNALKTQEYHLEHFDEELVSILEEKIEELEGEEKVLQANMQALETLEDQLEKEKAIVTKQEKASARKKEIDNQSVKNIQNNGEYQLKGIEVQYTEMTKVIQSGKKLSHFDTAYINDLYNNLNNGVIGDDVPNAFSEIYQTTRHPNGGFFMKFVGHYEFNQGLPNEVLGTFKTMATRLEKVGIKAFEKQFDSKETMESFGRMYGFLQQREIVNGPPWGAPIVG